MAVARMVAVVVVALLGAAIARQPARADTAPLLEIRVTWYGPTGNRTFYGEAFADGGAGCGWSLPRNLVVEFPDGRVARCNDRGSYFASQMDLACTAGYAACQRLIPGIYGDYAEVAVLDWGEP